MKKNTRKVLVFQGETAESKDLLWNMSDDEQVKQFIDELQAEISNNQMITAGLVLLITEIENKKNFRDAQDFCALIIDFLFPWTTDCNQAQRQYVNSLKTRKVSEFT